LRDVVSGFKRKQATKQVILLPVPINSTLSAVFAYSIFSMFCQFHFLTIFVLSAVCVDFTMFYRLSVLVGVFWYHFMSVFRCFSCSCCSGQHCQNSEHFRLFPVFCSCFSARPKPEHSPRVFVFLFVFLICSAFPVHFAGVCIVTRFCIM